jgi:hypothetical protein
MSADAPSCAAASGATAAAPAAYFSDEGMPASPSVLPSKSSLSCFHSFREWSWDELMEHRLPGTIDAPQAVPADFPVVLRPLLGVWNLHSGYHAWNELIIQPDYTYVMRHMACSSQGGAREHPNPASTSAASAATPLSCRVVGKLVQPAPYPWRVPVVSDLNFLHAGLPPHDRTTADLAASFEAQGQKQLRSGACHRRILS